MNSGSEAESFSFEVSQRGRDKEVLYRLGGRQLRIYLEMQGSGQHDYSAITQNFETWTVPEGEPLTESEALLAQERLRQWGITRHIRISIERGMSRDESIAQMEREGWTHVVRSDGSRMLVPPPPRSILQRIVRLVLG